MLDGFGGLGVRGSEFWASGDSFANTVFQGLGCNNSLNMP